MALTAAVPASARARALGALVQPGEHAAAFAAMEGDGVLQGFVLEGLARGERVLLATGGSPRAGRLRLRAAGIGPPAARPGALHVEACSDPRACALGRLARELDRAQEEGYEGLRVAHVAPPGAAKDHAAHCALPRRLRRELTVLCLFDPGNLRGVAPEDAWGLARRHARVLCV